MIALHRRVLVVAVLSLAALSACQPKLPRMTPEESKRIDDLTTKLTQRCVGRYMIEMPAAFVLNDQSRTEIEGVTIKVDRMARPEFDRRLERRRQVLVSEKLLGSETPSLIELRKLPNDQGMVFDRSRSQESPVLRTWELMSWSSGHSITMTVNSADTRLSATQYPPEAQEVSGPEKLSHLLNVYERTRGRNDDEVPSEQGVCFANGFTKGPPTDKEWVDMYHHLNGVPDVYFAYHSLSHVGPEKTTLLQRGKDIETMLTQVHGKTLRKGSRQQHGMEFDEWLMMRAPDGVENYHATLEANSLFGNATRPLFIVDFSSGVEHPGPELSLEQVAVHKPILKATLGEAESVALWDKMTATLRPRPGAF